MLHMKLISWNVNGIRAWHKKEAYKEVFKLKPDILCLQEIKAEESQIPQDVSCVTGYTSIFESSKAKKGYSGVAVYTKDKPVTHETKLGVSELDQEGRVIVAIFEKIVLLNCYFPNGGGGPERLEYKLKYYDQFLKVIEKYRKDGYGVIFCGDINTAHKEVDLARPKENEKNTGFLPIERAWIDKLVSLGYVDTFRHVNRETKDAYSYWDMKTFARQRNVGWRIDYFFVSPDLVDKIKDAYILSDIQGSDHCPIVLEIDL